VAGFALVLGAAATTPVWGVRPQMFTFLFASIFLCVLDSFYRNQSKRAIWWLVPLTILWANMHAGFLLGLALIAITIVGLVLDAFFFTSDSRDILQQRVLPLFGLLLCCAFAGSLNPNGFRLYWYPIETVTTPIFMRVVEEWKSPDFHQPSLQPVLLLLIATFSILALSNKRVRLSELLMLSVTTVAALRTGRNIGFFSLVATPLFAEHLDNWLTSQRWAVRIMRPKDINPKRGSSGTVVLSSLIIVLAITLSILGIKRTAAKQAEIELEQFPSALVTFMLAQRLPQPIYNEYDWGGYLIWRLYPSYQVYIDGRADVYGGQLVEEFIQVHDVKPGWQEVLKERGIRTVLVEVNSALASLLREKSDWKKVFENKQAVIFVRPQ
jgi:hypothetical protein